MNAPTPINLLYRFGLFVVGNVVLAAGIVVSIKNPWGASAWDAFHVGLALRSGLSLGTAIILVSLAVLLISFLLGGGWTIRLGTLLNGVLIGPLVDLYGSYGLPPDPEGILWGCAYLFGGIFLLALGSVLYVRAGLGAGPRDGLTLTASQRAGLTIGRSKAGLEITVALCGWALGGPVGIGTVIISAGTGPACDLLFWLMGRGWLPDRVHIPGDRPRDREVGQSR